MPEGISFPQIRQIIDFEGRNGPDGIKRKSPSVDEPWHFIDPASMDSAPLLDVIDSHINSLYAALDRDSMERAAFEAAWLAHAVTDGLTPAHHFPLEETLVQLRGGKGLETRNSLLQKGLMTGAGPIELIKNNWKYWGAKGAMTTHLAFEAGVASVVAYQRFQDGIPTRRDIDVVRKFGYRKYFQECVRQISEMEMYERFYRSGWTAKLAKQTNQDLIPLIIRAVVLAWLAAIWRLEEARSA